MDWLDTLIECKNRIRQNLSPLLGTVDKPQPDLGVGAGGDRIKRVDLAAEAAVVEVLTGRAISFTLISEESGVQEYGNRAKECFVTVDPVDGTTNLMRRLPFYATSIAVSERPLLRNVHSGLVADLCHDVTYTAQRGKGSCRDGVRISPSSKVGFEEAVIGLDVNSYRIDALVPRLTGLVKKTDHIRHFGANALELCYVADGSTDAFVDIRGKLRTTDVAAACLILEEAGGVVTTSSGQVLDSVLDPVQKVEFVAAGNRKLHRMILDLVNLESG